MIFTICGLAGLEAAGRRASCALGPAGIVDAAAKREGDGATPAGTWPLRRVLYRADRLDRPMTELEIRSLRPNDGWCDQPDDPAYNCPVVLPYRASAERLWREDAIYDVIVVLGYNDAPVIRAAGSAIFLHVARPGFTPTQGCVAVERDDLLALLALSKPGDALRIVADASST